MEWSTLSGILVVLFGGLNIFQFVFLKATKREYEAKADKAKHEAQSVKQQNESAAVQTLKEAIEKMTEINKDYANDKVEMERRVEEALERCVRKDDTIATLLTLVCKHMGCGAREPIPGQGRLWYEQHKDDISLGIDYLPINQIIRQYGERKRRMEMQNEAEGNGEV